MSENKFAGLTALQENVVKTKEHVEAVRAVLDAQKANVFQVTSVPATPTVGQCIQWLGNDTASMKKGSFYQYQEVTPSTDPPTYQWVELTSSIDIDNVLDPTSGNPVANSGLTNVIQALQSGVLVIYAQESERLQEINYSSGQIVALNTICYCVAEETWYRVTAINASSLEITWTAYDPKIATDTDVEKRLEKVTALPTASVDNLGEILLLTSAQTGYEAGGIYRCVSDGEATPTYSWELISMSPLEFDTDDFEVTNDVVSLNPNQRIFKGTKETWEALTLEEKAKYTIVIFTNDNTSQGSSGGGGTTNYNDLTNKPSINGVILTGNKTLTNLGAQSSTLTTPIVLGGTSYTTVESALTAMATIINNSAYWQ